MEEEIDLRPYIETLINRWVWIVGGAILCGIIAFGISSLQPPKYEATAIVAVSIPQELTLASLTEDTLVPSFTTRNVSVPFLRALPELATSDQLLRDLLQSVDPPLEDVTNIEEFIELLNAESGNDPTLIRLSVTYPDPETAALIANNWANLYVPWVNTVYSLDGIAQVDFLEGQLESLEADLMLSEQALIDFEGNNRALILQNNLTFLTEQQSELFTQQKSLQSSLKDVAALTMQIESASDNVPVTFSHQLTALNLQLAAFGVEDSNLLQIQVDTDTNLTTASKTDHLVFLADLNDTLEGRLTQTEEELAQIEPEILTMQQQLQEAQTEQNRLNRDYNEVEESYTALVRKVESEKLSAEDSTTGVRLVGLAIAPSEPVSRGRLLITMIFAIIGGLLAAAFIIWREIRHERMSSSAP